MIIYRVFFCDVCLVIVCYYYIIGACPAEEPYISIGYATTVAYFLFFILSTVNYSYLFNIRTLVRMRRSVLQVVGQVRKLRRMLSDYFKLSGLEMIFKDFKYRYRRYQAYLRYLRRRMNYLAFFMPGELARRIYNTIRIAYKHYKFRKILKKVIKKSEYERKNKKNNNAKN